MLLHTKPLEAKSRPYLAVGGGMKYYRGTGAEQVYQPLGNIALLTQTHDMRPLLSVGGGVKWRVGQNVYLRLDVRDYITPFPKKVITPVGNVKADGWIHNITPMIGFTFTF
jgi:hypothetical protein